jgi:hypothetical protein
MAQDIFANSYFDIADTSEVVISDTESKLLRAHQVAPKVSKRPKAPRKMMSRPVSEDYLE